MIRKKLKTIDILYIAVFAALGLAVKPIVSPLNKLVPIPGGSMAGGFYMMWMAIAVASVRRFGTGILFGVVQMLVVLSIGFFGNHGLISLITYTLPGLVMDTTGLFMKTGKSPAEQVILCTTGNMTGAVIVAFLVMRLAFIPLMISLTAAAISGIIGGLTSYYIIKQLQKYELMQEL